MNKQVGGVRLTTVRIQHPQTNFQNNSNEKGIEGVRLIIPRKNWTIGVHHIAQSFVVLQKHLQQINLTSRPRAIETNQTQTHQFNLSPPRDQNPFKKNTVNPF